MEREFERKKRKKNFMRRDLHFKSDSGKRAKRLFLDIHAIQCACRCRVKYHGPCNLTHPSLRVPLSAEYLLLILQKHI